jgi:hypothetical protein
VLEAARPPRGGATDQHPTNVDLLNPQTKTVVAIFGHGEADQPRGYTLISCKGNISFTSKIVVAEGAGVEIIPQSDRSCSRAVRPGCIYVHHSASWRIEKELLSN